jgi:hypothetical protein
MTLGHTNIEIEPDMIPEEEFQVHLNFLSNSSTGEDYQVQLRPEEWQVLKDLVDETFRHMQTYLDRLPKEDEDEEE